MRQPTRAWPNGARMGLSTVPTIALRYCIVHRTRAALALARSPSPYPGPSLSPARGGIQDCPQHCPICTRDSPETAQSSLQYCPRSPQCSPHAAPRETQERRARAHPSWRRAEHDRTLRATCLYDENSITNTNCKIEILGLNMSRHELVQSHSTRFPCVARTTRVTHQGVGHPKTR